MGQPEEDGDSVMSEEEGEKDKAAEETNHHSDGARVLARAGS